MNDEPRTHGGCHTAGPVYPIPSKYCAIAFAAGLYNSGFHLLLLPVSFYFLTKFRHTNLVNFDQMVNPKLAFDPIPNADPI